MYFSSKFIPKPDPWEFIKAFHSLGSIWTKAVLGALCKGSKVKLSHWSWICSTQHAQAWASCRNELSDSRTEPDYANILTFLYLLWGTGLWSIQWGRGTSKHFCCSVLYYSSHLDFIQDRLLILLIITKHLFQSCTGFIWQSFGSRRLQVCPVWEETMRFPHVGDRPFHLAPKQSHHWPKLVPPAMLMSHFW